MLNLLYFCNKKSARHEAMRRKTPVFMPPSKLIPSSGEPHKKSVKTAFLPEKTQFTTNGIYLVCLARALYHGKTRKGRCFRKILQLLLLKGGAV